MTAISVENVTKRYGDTVALDDVSFEIEDGQFVILLGPSGAGKSTLLRILNGLTEPTSGTVSFGDRSRISSSEIGMVFQMHYLIENLSAYRNALTGALSRAGTPASVVASHEKADEERALRALETVGLLDEARQRAGSMSGGQQQRVGIARALTQDPELLLADEPVASLDPKAAQDVVQYMRQAAVERNLTSIVSLHQVNIAREFGDHFVGLHDGEVVFQGGRDDLTMDVVDQIYYGDDSDKTGDEGIQHITG